MNRHRGTRTGNGPLKVLQGLGSKAYNIQKEHVSSIIARDYLILFNSDNTLILFGCKVKPVNIP